MEMEGRNAHFILCLSWPTALGSSAFICSKHLISPSAPPTAPALAASLPSAARRCEQRQVLLGHPPSVLSLHMRCSLQRVHLPGRNGGDRGGTPLVPSSTSARALPLGSEQVLKIPYSAAQSWGRKRSWCLRKPIVRACYGNALCAAEPQACSVGTSAISGCFCLL